MLISYWRFSSPLLLSIVMIGFFILSKKLFSKRKELSDARVVSITKKEYSFAVFFIKIHKVDI